MTSSTTTHLADLPLCAELSEADWGVDLSSTAHNLFSHQYQGLLQWTDGSAVAYRNCDVHSLSTNPSVGNLPAPLLAASLTAAAGPGAGGWERWLGEHIFTMTPPLHGPIRQIFAKHFTRGKMSEYQALAARAVEEILAETPMGTKIEFQDDVANKIAGRFWSGILDLTPAEEHAVQDLSSRMGPGVRLRQEPAQAKAVDNAANGYMDVLTAAINRVLKRNENQMLSAMAEDLRAVDLPDKPTDLAAVLASTLFDAFHTMKVGISNVIFVLLDNGCDLRTIGSDRGLLGKSIAEALRLATPVAITQRYALEGFQHDSTEIPAGAPITMLWGVANRDPQVFPNPNSFDSDRATRPQVTFGGGLYICPGRNAATLLAGAVLQGFAEDGLEIEIVGPTAWEPASSFTELKGLPVELRLAR